MTTSTIPDLRAALEAAATDSERLSVMQALATQLRNCDVHAMRDLASKSLDIAERLGDERATAEGLCLMADAKADMGEYQQALDDLNRAGEIYRRVDDRTGIRNVTGASGYASVYMGEFDRALEQFQLALKLSEDLGDRRGIAIWTGSLGNVYRELRDDVQAMQQYRAALALAEELGDQKGIMIMMGNIAGICSDRGDNGEALRLYRSALEKATELGDRYRIALWTGSIGIVYGSIGEYVKALEHLLPALELAEEMGDARGAAIRNGNLGNIYHDIGDHSKALRHYQRALDLLEESGDRRRAADCLVNIAAIYNDLGEHIRALEQFHAARALFEELGDRKGLVLAMGNIGGVHHDLREYAEALNQYRAAQLLSEELGDHSNDAIWMARVGGIYATPEFEGYDPDRAEEYLLRAVDLASRSEAKPGLMSIHESLSTLLHHQKKWQQALHHTIQYQKLKEEIDSHEAREHAQRIEHRRELAEIDKQRAIELAGARAAGEIQRMKAEQMQRELGNATLQLLAQTELLADLRTDLLKIARKIPPTEPGARELRERVKNLPCQSVDWEKFDRQFRAVHPDFIRTLTGRAPDLTATEVRICTMLRMNLKSQEMAQIFCISESGVEFHRKHIRKKLKLGQEEKLPLVLGAM